MAHAKGKRQVWPQAHLVLDEGRIFDLVIREAGIPLILSEEIGCGSVKSGQTGKHKGPTEIRRVESIKVSCPRCESKTQRMFSVHYCCDVLSNSDLLRL